MVLNQQKRVKLKLQSLRFHFEKVREELGLSASDFNVCLVDDRTIRKLNERYRSKPRPTDVLSFPWRGRDAPALPAGVAGGEFEGFLGDVVISVETALRNARREGHSLEREIDRLILHGVLHLMGYDHETDDGEMKTIELAIRGRLRIGGNGHARARRGPATLSRQPR